MATLSAFISQACESGAGVLTLTQAEAIAPAEAVLAYFWSVRNIKGEEFGVEVDPSGLPFRVDGLPNGTYTSQVRATDDTTGIIYQSRPFSFTFTCKPAFCDLLLSEVTGIAPASAGTLGTIGFRVSSTQGPVTVSALLLADGLSAYSATVPGDNALQQLRVTPGVYRLTARDAAGCEQQQASVTVPAYATPVRLGCTDPAADNYDPTATQDDGSCVITPAPRRAYFEVPLANSLRFTQPGRGDLDPFDNTPFAYEEPLDYDNPGYCQLVEQRDTLVLQALSNYQGVPELQLFTKDGNVAGPQIAGQLVQQGAGATATFEVYLRPDVESGRTRLYFNEEALPLPFGAGQRVTVSAGSGTTGVEGTFPVQDVREDGAAAVPYLLLPAPYPAGAPVRLDGTLTTTYAVQAFDTYQFVLPFAGQPEGGYFVHITATDPAFADALAVSEPINVAYRHEGSVRLSYRNFDNAFGLNYSSGLVGRVRVMGRFFERKANTERTVERNDDDSLVLLTAAVRRRVELQTLLQAGWVHEKLAVIFAHDYVRVNDTRVVLEQDYEHEPVDRYTLSGGTALLEAVGFLGAGNRDDVGDVDQGGGDFLYAGDGTYLNANP